MKYLNYWMVLSSTVHERLHLHVFHPLFPTRSPKFGLNPAHLTSLPTKKTHRMRQGANINPAGFLRVSAD